MSITLDINKLLSNFDPTVLKVKTPTNDSSTPKINIKRETDLILSLLDPVNKILIIAIGPIPFEPNNVEKSIKLAPEKI